MDKLSEKEIKSSIYDENEDEKGNDVISESNHVSESITLDIDKADNDKARNNISEKEKKDKQESIRKNI